MPMSAVFRLATRGSPLALVQAGRVAALLERTGVATELVTVETEGDRRTDVSLGRIGGQGIFVKEVQAAVVRGDADAAVHSAKDLPASPGEQVPGLVLAAVPERGDPRDALVGGSLRSLRTAALVATGSPRRRAQLANLRPDLAFTDLRGNLATRLAAVGAGGVDAVVVARAALERLSWEPPPGCTVEVLSPSVMVPQVGQGSLAVECREGDGATLDALASIDDRPAHELLLAERAFLAALGGGCTLPVGATARWTGPTDDGSPAEPMTLIGMLASFDGKVVLRHGQVGSGPEELGRSVACYLLDEAGGRELDLVDVPAGAGTGDHPPTVTS